MTYVISDIHGCYDKYMEMLEKISLSESDALYVIGDVVDRAPGGVDILRDMGRRDNVIPILGNHEYMAYSMLKHVSSGMIRENYSLHMPPEIKEAWQEWMLNGGYSTAKAFSLLSDEDKQDVLEYLEEFSLYETVEIRGREFVLVHAGLGGFSPEKPLEDYTMEQLTRDRCDYGRVYFSDKYLVTGHTPTFVISERYRGRIYTENNHIAIDCGATAEGRLGCLRLDDMFEFYV